MSAANTTCPPCNHNCSQSDTCPARKAQETGFDPVPEISNWEVIGLWVGIGFTGLCTLIVVCGAMGYAYLKWVP